MSLRACSDNLTAQPHHHGGAVRKKFEELPDGASVLNLPGRFTLSVNCAGKFKAALSPVPRALPRSRVPVAGIVEIEKAQKQVEKHEIFHGNRLRALNSPEEFAVTTWHPPLGRQRMRAGYGGACRPYNFTRSAAEQVQEACVILGEKFGKRAVFLTFTLPTSSAIAAQVVSEWSGWLVKNVRQWIRDKVQAQHSVVGVWEWQKRGALHLHVAVASESIIGLTVLLSECKRAWASLLVTLTRRTGVNLFSAINHSRAGSVMSWLPNGAAVQVDGEWVKKSLARYLSKYTSKVKQAGARAALFFPSRWWTCDRETLRAARERRVRLSLEGFDLAAWRLPFQEVVAQAVAKVAKVFQCRNPRFEVLPVCVALGTEKEAHDLLTKACEIVELFDGIVKSRREFMQCTKRGALNAESINAVGTLTGAAVTKDAKRAEGARLPAGESNRRTTDSGGAKRERREWAASMRKLLSSATWGAAHGETTQYNGGDSD